MKNKDISQTTKKESKAKLRFNIIDFVIIIALAACVFGIYIRFTVGDELASLPSELKEARIEFLLCDIEEQIADSLTAGSLVYGEGGDTIGELSAILSKLPSEHFVATTDGRIIKTYSGEFTFDIKGVINAKGIMSEKGFLLDGKTYLAAGSIISAQTSKVRFTLEVTKIVLE